MLYSFEKRQEIRKTKAFKETNKIWNELKLNQVRSIGAMIYLLRKSKAKSLEEWAKYYFKSGQERENNIKRYYIDYKKILREYGRTERELIAIAKKMKPYCNDSLELAYNYVYIRVIDETWIGYNREVVAKNNIENYLKNISLEYKLADVDCKIDITYAVDFEIYKNGKLVLGIQLKSDRYLNANTEILKETKNFNKERNDKYTEMYNVEVIYLYTDEHNEIINLSELEEALVGKKKSTRINLL